MLQPQSDLDAAIRLAVAGVENSLYSLAQEANCTPSLPARVAVLYGLTQTVRQLDKLRARAVASWPTAG